MPPVCLITGKSLFPQSEIALYHNIVKMAANIHTSDTAGHQQYTNGHDTNINGQHQQQPGHTGVLPKPHQSMVSQVYDPTFFKIANPGPLGLISFALTTFVLGLYQCGAG